MGCDGVGAGGDLVDVVYEKGAEQILFDGKGKASGLSKDIYATKVTETDTRYAALLEAVLKAMRAGTETAATTHQIRRN